jgi:4a-hydroxytetrahydrobiopterin dehydratase
MKQTVNNFLLTVFFELSLSIDRFIAPLSQDVLSIDCACHALMQLSQILSGKPMENKGRQQALGALDADETKRQLLSLPLWQLDDEGVTIQRAFTFSNFKQAFAFMTQVAEAAELQNHHPEWRNVYNKVWMTWTTHDVKGLSMKDIQMAHLCDRLCLDHSPT